MLRYPLDEHLSPAIADQLAARRPELPIVALQALHGGALLGADDVAILTAASSE